jgi:hypothetical protein
VKVETDAAVVSAFELVLRFIAEKNPKVLEEIVDILETVGVDRHNRQGPELQQRRSLRKHNWAEGGQNPLRRPYRQGGRPDPKQAPEGSRLVHVHSSSIDRGVSFKFGGP